MKIKQLATVAALSIMTFFGAASVAHADTIYTVKSGDTLSEILTATGKGLGSMDQVAADNNIADVNLIYVGQKLIFKDDGQVAVATPSEVQSTPEANTVQQAAAQEKTAATTIAAANQPAAPAANTTAAATTAPATNYAPAADYQGDDAAAREWIAARESGGSYTANNGAYIGKYQMSAAYLNGDYSPANQDRVANNYVSSRYGSWTAAKQFWQANGWY